MGFLTILNYIATAVGYAVIIVIIIFILWMVVDVLKERQIKKRWERERISKKKAEDALAKRSGEETANPVSVITSLKTTAQTATKVASNQKYDEKQAEREQHKNRIKEQLIDEKGKIKMVN